jgi:hypothetical protein
MSSKSNFAPGHPGIPPRWTSSAKSGVGTSLSSESRVWFTLSHGILNEVYYPRVDQACIRNMELLVSDGMDFFSEGKRHTQVKLDTLADGVPAFQLTHTCKDSSYRIHKTVLTDPQRDVLLQRIRFKPLQGSLSDYHLYVLLAPHLGNHGSDNTAWLDDYKGLSVFSAQRGEIALSLICSVPWLKRSVGFVGASDGWQDIFQHKQMLWEYTRAEDGKVALTGKIDLEACNGDFIFALFLGAHSEYLKLCRSLANGRVFNMPPQTTRRYSKPEITGKYALWAINHKVRKMAHGKTLRQFLPAPAQVHWSVGDWTRKKEINMHDSTLGIHVVDLPTRRLKAGTTICFTIYWLDKEHWEATDHVVEIRKS